MLYRLYAKRQWKNFCGCGGEYSDYGGEYRSIEDAERASKKWYEEYAQYEDLNEFKNFYIIDEDGNVIKEWN